MNDKTLRIGIGLAAVAALGASVATAWWWQEDNERPTAAVLASTDHLVRSWDLPKAAPTNAPAAEPAEPPRLTARLQQLAAENRRLQTAMEDLKNWILDNFQGKVPLSERLMGRVRLPALTDDARFDPDLAEFLGVNEAEQQSLDTAFAQTLTLIRTAESGVMQLKAESSGVGEVIIPPFPDIGAGIEEDLYGELGGVLGQDRFDRFCAVAGNDLDRRMNYFGRAERRLRFESRVAADGSPKLFIRDETALTDQKTGIRRIEATEQTTAEVPEAYLPYLTRLVAVTPAEAPASEPAGGTGNAEDAPELRLR